MVSYTNYVICLKVGKDRLFLNKEQIVMFKIVGRRVEVITDSNIYYINTSLSEIEKKLGDESFFRVNQSCIVNINRIEKIETSKKNKYIKFIDFNDKVIISQEKIQKLLSFVKIL